jgi:hypothetical protein
LVLRPDLLDLGLILVVEQTELVVGAHLQVVVRRPVLVVDLVAQVAMGCLVGRQSFDLDLVLVVLRLVLVVLRLVLVAPSVLVVLVDLDQDW